MDSYTRYAGGPVGVALAALLTVGATGLVAAADDGADTTPAVASPPSAVPGEEAPADDTAAAEVPEIVVTGSRIRREEFTFSNPVVSVGAETIRQSGSVNLTDYLKELPALTASFDSHDGGDVSFTGATGLEQLNLRNLGVERTLVLVDGRRHVGASDGSTAIDIDTIPLELIERVDVLTGGASAIYGADGVSGVVNFVTKRDFDGLSLRVQGGQSGKGDSDTGLLSLVAGRNFLADRGNATVSLQYSRSDALAARDRSFAGGSRALGFVNNPFDLDDDPGIPDTVPLRDLRYLGSSPGGAIDVDTAFFSGNDDEFFTGVNNLFDFRQPDLNADGTPFDYGTEIPNQSSFQQGGDGTRIAGYARNLLPEEDRYVVNTLLTYELTDRVRAFGDLKYARTEAFSEGQPTFDFFLYLEPDYAYTPDAIAAAADGGPLLITRDNLDLGYRNEDVKRETYRGVLGLDGDLNDDVRFEMSLVYGKTESRIRSGNNRLNDRYFAALDAVQDPETGEITCRSNLDPDAVPFNVFWQTEFLGNLTVYDPLPDTWAATFNPGADSGCVPLNIIGDGSVSDAARDWIMQTTTATSEVDQLVFQAYVSGKTFNWFAPGASPMGYVLGVERRLEESEATPSREDRIGVTTGNRTPPSGGRYDVSEAFFEIDVPVIEDRPLAKRLALDAAIRLSDYNTVGNTRTWKVGASWQPVSDLTFRSTRAKAVRAPNIGELFLPASQTFGEIADPCAATNLDRGTASRRANCAELLSSLGIEDPASFDDPSAAFLPGSRLGNEDLGEETANSTTIGVVLQPSFLAGLSISLDWYDIEIEDAVTFTTGQESAELCVDAPSLDNQFCNLVVREDGTARIVDFTEQFVNVANFVTKGYDLNLNYRIDPAQWESKLDIGRFDVRVVANKLERLAFVNSPGAPSDEDTGEANAPEWQAVLDLTWYYGKATLNYGLNYFDQTSRFSREEVAGDPDIVDSRYLEFDSKVEHDAYAAYELLSGLTIYSGVNNFTDRKPDIGENFYPVSAVGRFFFAGVRFEAF